MLEIGGSLREARSRAGLELTEVEAATLIPVRHLRALEEERFERLPAGPYGRSFLREYAEFLGLDPDVYSDEYDLRLAPPEPERSNPPARRRRLVDELSPARMGAVAVLVAAGAAVWLLGTGGTGPVKPGSATTVARTQIQTRPKHASRPRHPAPVVAQPSTRPRAALRLTAARGDCWLSVRIGSSTGPTVYEHTLQQGETVRFGLRKPLWVRIGAPWNLDATIDRRSVTSMLPRSTGDTFATAAGMHPAS